MTPGMIIMLLFVGWIALALWFGKFVYRHVSRRWAQVTAVLVVLWLPLWDVIPGLFFYSKAVREVSGVRISERVQADGYLDLSATDSYQWGMLRALPYHYIEIRTASPYADPAHKTLVDVPGYYQFSFAPEGDARCADIDALYDRNSIRAYLPAGTCIVVARQDDPVSRYEYERSHGWDETDRYGWFPWIEFGWEEIRDRQASSVIADAVRVRYVSWLGRKLGLFVWVHERGGPDHRPLYLDIREVIRVVNGEREKQP